MTPEGKQACPGQNRALWSRGGPDICGLVARPPAKAGSAGWHRAPSLSTPHTSVLHRCPDCARPQPQTPEAASPPGPPAGAAPPKPAGARDQTGGRSGQGEASSILGRSASRSTGQRVPEGRTGDPKKGHGHHRHAAGLRMGGEGPGPALVSGHFRKDKEMPPHSASTPPGGPVASALPDLGHWTSSSSRGHPPWLWALHTPATSSDRWGLGPKPHSPEHEGRIKLTLLLPWRPAPSPPPRPGPACAGLSLTQVPPLRAVVGHGLSLRCLLQNRELGQLLGA